MHHQQVCSLQFGRHISQFERCALEFANTLAELFTIRRPVDRQIQQTFRPPAATGTHPDPSHLDPLICQDETFAFFSQYLTRSDTAVIERQYKVQIGTLADTAGSAYDIKTRMSAVNQKCRDPFAWTAIGFIDSSHCKNNSEIRQKVTADEMF